MKLKCPACGTPIPADRINIQQMVAICPHCDNIFKIDNPFTQRRKLKAPAQFRVAEDSPDRLDMAFKWSWRTEPPFGLFAVVFALVVSLATLFAMIAEGAPPAAGLLPLALAGLMGYVLLTLAFNSTHYESNGEVLKVYTEPLPFLRYGSKTLAIDEIEQVTVERPAYAPFPDGKDGFYDVYVHTLDGGKVRIAAIVNYEHAHFIAQEIESYAQTMRDTPDQSLFDAPDEAEPELLDDVSSSESERKALRS